MNSRLTGTRKRKARPTAACCPPKPALHERPLIAPDDALELTDIFKIFANDTRLRLLHALIREGEMCVNDIAATVDMKAQAISNQLQRLVDQRVVSPRRSGLNIYYRIVDPCVARLLDLGLCLAEDRKSGHHGA